MRTSGLAALLGIALAVHALPAEKKKRKGTDEELVTQVRELPKDPPPVIKVDTSRLVVDVSPLSAKGLLSQQVREALKALLARSHGATMVRLRAFVAGSGDVRRVQMLVSAMFSEKRLPLPVLTVVQVGGLPLPGAQVVIESTAETKKPVNPDGLAFVSGHAVRSDDPTADVAPLAGKSAADLVKTLQSVQLEPSDVLRVTCFSSSLQDFPKWQSGVAAVFPQASLNIVQVQRAPVHAIVECEAVARLRAPLDQPLRFLDPQGPEEARTYSQVALVGASRIALTGAQLGFRYQDEDIRLAFQRLGKVLGEAGTSLDRVAVSNIYPLTGAFAQRIRKIRTEFYSKAHPPAATMLPFEDLPALDASFAVDAVAVVSQ